MIRFVALKEGEKTRVFLFPLWDDTARKQLSKICEKTFTKY